MVTVCDFLAAVLATWVINRVMSDCRMVERQSRHLRYEHGPPLGSG